MAWHAQLLEKIIAAQPLSQDALAQLQQQRGLAVQKQLTQAALPPNRMALGAPEELAKKEEDGVATRLELAPLQGGS